jgi:hypothetical protein
MFIKLENGQPVGSAITEDNLRLLFPHVNFSWPFVAEDLEPIGFGLWDFSSPPELGVFEKAVEGALVKDEYNRWRPTWAVVPMTEEEITARTEQEWNAVRNQRNYLLAACDWTQILDAPADAAAWAVYRQALRDITEQTDPFNIVWPTPPSIGPT